MMKTDAFRCSIKFTNMFTMLNFCKKRGLTTDNSLLVEIEPGAVYTLYYNQMQR